MNNDEISTKDILSIACVLLLHLICGDICYAAGLTDGQNQMQKHMDAGLIRVKDENSNTYYWIKAK